MTTGKAMRRGEERVPLLLKVMTKTNKQKTITKNKKRKQKDIKNDDTI